MKRKYTRHEDKKKELLKRFFADLHIPPETNQRDFIRRKYGPEALALIDELI